MITRQCPECHGQGTVTVKGKSEWCRWCEGIGFYPWVDPAKE